MSTSRSLLTFMSRPSRPAVTLAAALSILNGCATIGRDPQNQSVLIQSDPPGASIHLEGKSVGQTPMYVLVPREKKPKLILSRDHVSREVLLDTHYRWGASFFSNFVFYVAAPVGWVADLISGSAWTPQDPPVVSFLKTPSASSSNLSDELSPEARQEKLPAPLKVAIAPPKSESLSLSNAALPVLTEAINERRRLLGYSIVPYEQSLPMFLKHGFDFDGDGSDDDRRMLDQSLNATAVWQSSFVRTNNSLNLRAVLEDTRTRAKLDEINLMLDPSDERSRAYAQGFHYFVLPNAVAFSLSTQYFTFDRTGAGSISLQAADNRLWWQKGLQYLSGVSIQHIPEYRPGRAGRWVFDLSPTARFSRRDLVANGSSEIDGQGFTRWLAAGGYGPEVGYRIGKHYFYGDLDLNAVWTTISWKDGAQDFSTTRFEAQTSFEIGYLYTLTDIWSFRLFAASFPENSQAWREALDKTSHGAIGSANEGVANNLNVGVALGFSFEPFLVRTFREKIRKVPGISPAPFQASN